MPAEYMNCVKSEMKNGKSKKQAQKMCAISYYKRHGKTPQEGEEAALAMLYDEIEAAKVKRMKRYVRRMSSRDLPK